LQCLANSGNIAMPKYSKTSAKELLHHAVPLDVLMLQELNNCLCSR